jgi:hypothetical protein
MIRIARVRLKEPIDVRFRRQHVCEGGEWRYAVFELHRVTWVRIR